MNKQRRKELNDIYNQLEKSKEKFAESFDKLKEQLVTLAISAREELEEIRDNVQQVLDEEQEAYDNMPEGLQNAERGEQSSDSINEMESTISSIETVIGTMEEIESDDLFDMSELDTALEQIDNAKGQE